MSSVDELFNQMNPKRNPDELTENNIGQEDSRQKQEPVEDKFKSTIKEKGMDYYAILGVSKDTSSLEIKRAYQKKLKKFHPDKVAQTKENKLKFKLIREAGDTLTHSQKRKAYDAQRKLDATSHDFLSQRDNFKEFMKLQEQSMTDEDRAIAKLNFERGFVDLNKKHGYDEKNEDAMTKEEHDRRMEDLILQREQEGLEINHENMFEGRQFNRVEFNKMFEKKKRRDSKRKKQGGLVKYNDGIAAFNDLEGGFGGVSVDNYGGLYSEGKFDDFNENYAGIGSGMMGADDGASDDDLSIDSPDENDEGYDTHNQGISKESLDAAMKRMMAERDSQDDKFKTMVDADFGSAMDDKYGISNQFGFMVGTDKFGHQKIRKRDLKEDTLKAYKELTEN